MLEVEKITVGDLGANCYIVSDGRSCLIIDPGAESEKIVAKITQHHLHPLAILLTHCHFDHIGALEEIRKHYDISVYVPPEEKDWLADTTLNLSTRAGMIPVFASPAEYLLEIKTYQIGPFTFRVVPTPGHSPGGVSFIFGTIVFSGDALFKGSVGYTDLPGSNREDLLAGIRTQLFTLPEENIVYPGHREATTIGAEKRYNPHFNQ